ncbi:TPA: LysR substrate-binding domain-containing protein [Pseudomonas aeruginosa]
MSGELVFDLNALFIYAKVVEHCGFAPAGRVLGIPKSTISRKVAQLEARLGVRLVQRSTRQFQVTEIGQAYYRHCVAMTVEAEAAEDVIEQNRSEPCGMVRLTCSTPLLHFELAPMLARFMAQYPNVELYVKTFNRRVDVIAEGYDISLSLRFPPLEDSDLVMKVLARSPQVLVASPELLARYRPPELPADLSAMPYIGWERSRLDGSLRLVGADGSSAALNLRPQLLSDDLGTLRQAVLEGVGIGGLPLCVVSRDLAERRLVRVLPEWTPVEGMVVAMFPSRRGLLPSVRALIDFLAAGFADAAQRQYPEPG